MDKTATLKDTIAEYLKTLEEIKKCDELAGLSQLERKAMSALQLMQFQVGAAGDDLYRLTRDKRIALQAKAREASMARVKAIEVEAKEEPVEEVPVIDTGVSLKVGKHTIAEVELKATKAKKAKKGKK